MTNIAPIPGNLPIAARSTGDLIPGSPYGGASSGPRTSPIVRYLAAIRRIKWLVLLLTLAGLGAGIVVSRLRPASFVVNGALQLTLDESSPYIGAQYSQFIKSYEIIEPVAIDRRLFIIGPKRVGAPPLPPGPSGINASLFNGFGLTETPVAGTYRFKVAADGKTWELTNTATSIKDRGSAGDSAGGIKFGFRWLPVLEPRWFGETFEFDIITPREAADDIKNRLKVDLQPWQAPKFMYLTLDGQNSDQAAAILNDLMNRFVMQTSMFKRKNLVGQSAVLDSQLRVAQGRLNDDERSLQSYKVKTITLPRDQLPVAPGLAETQPSAYNAYLSRRHELEDLRRARGDLANALAKLQAGEPAIDLYNAIPSVRTSSPELMNYLVEMMTQEQLLRQYRVRYTDEAVTADGKIDMPKLVAHVKQLETVIVPEYTKVVLRKLDDLIQHTDSAVQVGSKELQEIPERVIEENALRREQSMQETVVASLTNQWYAARVKEAASPTDVAVMDRAVAPLRPTKNRSAIIIALGTLVGMAAGLGLALLLDLTDKRVRYVDQVTSGMGLTILGIIPEIRRAKGQQPTAEEAAQVIESFRSVRLNLAHAIGEGTVALTVSSPSPGDGKSLVSSNLALSFAESGYRTLLIDGDSRRGELHRTFGIERRPGLLDYLVGELGLEDLLRTTTHAQLSIITSGSRKRNAPELLGTARMRELITAMRSRFDVVIVDSPPLGAGIDPFVLATLTGNLLLVLRAGATERDLAEAKLQVVDQLPIRLVGAVLNDVRATMNDYKYYSYSYGYGSVDEREVTSIAARSTIKPES